MVVAQVFKVLTMTNRVTDWRPFERTYRPYPHGSKRPANIIQEVPGSTIGKVITYFTCYVYGSVHRWSVLIIVQRYTIQNSLFIILQVHSTCFGCQPHPSSEVHKTVTTASGTDHIFCAGISLQRGQAEGGSCTKNMTSTGGWSYSFVYSWWWVWLTPEICRVNLQNNLFININQLDALNFIISLFQASTCFEHMCSSSGGQNCIIQPLVSSHL
jgi:hypothetical protein